MTNQQATYITCAACAGIGSVHARGCQLAKPHPPPEQGVCGGCKRQVLWFTTRAGKKIPVEPHFRTVITEAGDYVRGYEAHFAYCPNAAAFRRRKAK